MKIGCALLVFLMLAMLGGEAYGQMDIYVFAGQSNMQGMAPLQGEPAPVNQGRLMMMYTPSGEWVAAKDPTSAYGGSGVGPALWAADRLASYYPGHTIGIVNAAKGGTYLWQWAPDYSTHSLYGNMMRLAREAAQCGTIKGFFWYQGEAEAEGNAGNVHAYGPQMHTLFESVRNDLGVPIVFVQLGPNPGAPYWPEIQVIQSWIAEGAPPWVSMVTAADLRTLAPNNPHLNQASQITLGGRLGDAMYQLLGGQ